MRPGSKPRSRQIERSVGIGGPPFGQLEEEEPVASREVGRLEDHHVGRILHPAAGVAGGERQVLDDPVGRVVGVDLAAGDRLDQLVRSDRQRGAAGP